MRRELWLLLLLLSLPGVGHAQDKGQLIVLTEPPGGVVTVDGTKVGTAPVTVKDLLPGKHLVAADNGKETLHQVVEIKAGESQLITLKFAAGALAPTPPPASTPATRAAPPPAPAEPSPLAPAAKPAEVAANAPVPQQIHREEAELRHPSFPGLVHPISPGVRFDGIAILSSPDKGGLGGRLRMESTLSRTISLSLDVYLPNKAVGPVVSIHLPRYLPLGPTSRLALQPRLNVLLYVPSEKGLFVGAEAELRLGLALVRNLIVGIETGVTMLGVMPIAETPYVSGVYVGLLFGGGVQWVF